MDLWSSISIGSDLWYFIPPMLLLPTVMFLCVWIYKILLDKVLPTKLYNFFIGPVVLIGFFIWAIPMNVGFYEFFRAIM